MNIFILHIYQEILKEYRKYYEPLIHKKDKEFKEGMQRARKRAKLYC